MIKLINTEHLDAQRLRLFFSDDSVGDYDFSPLLARDSCLTAELKSPGAFQSCFIELGALCWPNGLEFSAGKLHLDLEAEGKLKQSIEAA